MYARAHCQPRYTLLRASRYTRALGNVRERKKGGDREGERAGGGDVENTLHSRTREGATIGYIRVCSAVFVDAFPSPVLAYRVFFTSRDESRLCRVSFTTYSDTPLLEKTPHTGVKNRGKSIVERRGAPVATTETAWQSPLCPPLSLHSSSSIPLCIFYLHLPLAFPLCSFSSPFIYTNVSVYLFSSRKSRLVPSLSLYFPPSKHFLSLLFTDLPFLFFIALCFFFALLCDRYFAYCLSVVPTLLYQFSENPRNENSYDS